MSLQKFKEIKLTDNDLNEFKLLLSEFYLKKATEQEKLFVARKALKREEISKEEFTKIKNHVELLNNEYAKIAVSKAFKENYKNAKFLLKPIKEGHVDFANAKSELAFARHMYRESKTVIKERGRGAQLEKLNDIAVEVKKLSFKYGPEFPYALSNVNFQIKHGEYVTIIGHNGSGKSTLSKILIGVLTPEVGDLQIFGNTVNKNTLDQIRRFLGIVFQNPDNQFIGSTVRADIAFGLENKRVDPKDMETMITSAAKKVRMTDFLDHEPLNLSGGQKQRVAIASTLALNPDIIIFDEATSMLDPKGKREIKEIMVQLRDAGNKTIISITHDMDEILNADKVIVMNGGKLVKMGTPSEVLSDKEFLRSIHLDIPFIANVEEKLQNVGINVSGSKNMDELVDKLWQKK
ncbi:cobalt ABC transporter ATP-binding subunit [Williamsoniiplasma somnilux]|uniref:Cobalt ABC transporter ATP-binding subunit n=1 Tax=Williamsoniiplasma somnilux TaxID=215578 RepID=A0A2K8NXK0_9MOLU|nr:energy-coupling factor transporter ATPase [Williamsoniiplasma somnilux]ATZ18549.1 cobalt ABC transporter ATP-binding subunit [Williamsoniiplasma somnilux]